MSRVFVVCIGLLFFNILGIAHTTYAQFTPTIDYQGKLNDSAGVPVSNGTYEMHFRLYTAPSGGSPIWSEVDTITVTDGLFAHMLGSSSTLTSVDFNQPLYLGVEIAGDGEMTPRKPLGAVPAAFEAQNTQTFAGLATTSFLRSDQADEATSLITFSGGLLSSASSTITNLTTTFATTTNLIINNQRFTTLTGYGLTTSGTALTIDTTTLDTRYASTTTFDTEAELEALLTDVTNVFTNNDTIDISANTNLALTATGLTLNDDTIELTAGYTIPLTASTTAWQTFYDTPSSRISAGTGLSWSGNTLNAEVQSSDLASFGTDNQIPYMNAAGDDFEYSSNLVFDGTNLGVGTTTLGSRLTVDGSVEISDGNSYLLAGENVLSIGKGTDTYYANVFAGPGAGSGERRQTAFGFRAAYQSTGRFMTALGHRAFESFDGVDSTAVGYYAGRNASGNNLLLVGNSAGEDNTGDRVVAIGPGAGQGNSLNDQFIVKNSSSNAMPLIQGNFATGNVGIGTTSPQSMLDVWGDFRVGTGSAPLMLADASSNQLIFGTTTPFNTGSAGIYMEDTGITLRNSSELARDTTLSQTTFGQFNIDAHSILFGSSGGEVARFTNAGADFNLGQASGLDFRVRGGFDSYLLFANAGTDRVGIGTSTPSQKLTVDGNAYITGALFDSTNASGTNGMVLQSTGVGTQWVATSSLGFSSQSLSLGTDNQIPYMNAAGDDFEYSSGLTFDGTNLGVGSSSPTGLITIEDSRTSGDFLSIKNTSSSPWDGSSDDTAFISLEADTNTINGSNNRIIRYTLNGSERFAVDSSGRVGIANNYNASLPELFFTGDQDTGLYGPGGDSLSLVTGGTERLRINSTGNIGIGTTSPASTLDVWGDFRVGTSGTPTLYADPSLGSVYIGTTGSAPTQGVDGLYTLNVETTLTASSSKRSPNYFTTIANPSEASDMIFSGLHGNAQWDSTSNLISDVNDGHMIGVLGSVTHNSAATANFGIGVEGRIDIDSTGTLTDAYGFFSNAANAGGGNITNFYGYYFPDQSGISGITNKYSFFSADPTAQLINTGAAQIGTRLTISTSTPGAIGDGLMLSYASSLNSGADISWAAAGEVETAQIRSEIIGASNAYMAFSTYNGSLNEAMRIDGGGNVGIGTTTPGSLLTVDGDTDVKGELMVSGHLSGTNAGLILRTQADNEIRTRSDSFAGFDSNIRFRMSGVGGDDAWWLWSAFEDDSEYIAINPTDERIIGANQLDLQIASTSALFIDSSRNVGINEPAPSAQLHITNGTTGLTPAGAGANLLIDDNSNAGITIATGNAWASSIYFADSDDADIGTIQYAHPDDELRFRVNNAQRMVIDSSGNVGIGTTSPSSQLSVFSSVGNAINLTTQVGNGNDSEFVFNKARGGSGAAAQITTGDDLGTIRWQGFDGSVYQNSANIRVRSFANTGDLNPRMEFSADTFTFNSGNVTNNALYVDSTGNVGIGTSTIGAGLHIENLVGNAGLFINDTAGTNVDMNIGDTGGSVKLRNSGGDLTVFTGGDANDSNAANSSLALTIDSNGNLGIQDVSPTEAELVVGNQGAGEIYATFNTANSDTLCWDGAGASLITDCTSLSQYKDNQENLSIGLETLLQLQPREYDWNTGAQEHDLGFIAEEVEAVNPLLADYSNGTLSGVKYRHMTALIVQAIQDINSVVDLSVASTTRTSLTVDAVGNIGIGTTTPSAQLTTTGSVRFANFGAGTLTTDADGNVMVSSDERLKRILDTYDAGLDEVLEIEPVQYQWLKETGFDSEGVYTGFSAQNVAEVLPEAVGEDKNGFLTLSERPIVAAVVNAVKEIWEELTATNRRVDELEAEVEALRAMLEAEGVAPHTEPDDDDTTSEEEDGEEDDSSEDSDISEDDDTPTATTTTASTSTGVEAGEPTTVDEGGVAEETGTAKTASTEVTNEEGSEEEIIEEPEPEPEPAT